MKSVKKLFAMVLAVLMVISLATTAFAAETYTITAPATAHQYEIYQIFTGDLSGTKLSNVKWGTNGTGTTGTTVDDTVLETLTDLSGKTDSQQLAVITQYVTLSNHVATITNGETYSADAGYYLIRDKEKSVSGTDSYTLYIVEVVGNVTIDPKGSVPSVDKVIIEGDTTLEENEASIGETINYKFTGTLPSNIDDYAAYFYRFTDSMSKGLTYTGNLTVEVNDVDVTNYFYVNTEEDNAGGTTLNVAIQDLLALEKLDTVGDITDVSEVVVTYTAKLNESASVVDGNVNAVKLEYSNDPNNEGTGAASAPSENPSEPQTTLPLGVTAVDYVYTYTTEILLNKVDGESQILPGAAFQISGAGVNVIVTTGEIYVANAQGTYYKLADGTYTETAPTDETTADYADTATKYSKESKATIDTKAADPVKYTAFVDNATGQVKFTGLGAGTYTVTEIVTPAGYNTIDPFTVTIGWDGSEEENKDDENGCAWTYEWSNNADNTTNASTVVNLSGSTLPTTGGVGTTMFYIVGGTLVLAAVILLVTKKRMSADE